ncbi:MAG: ATPase, partial [Frankiales bacterium]|nr:ATPase [Frankiales bacterium]
MAVGRTRALVGAASAWRAPLLLILTLVALAVGSVAWLAGNSTLADASWIAGTAAGLLPAAVWVVIDLVHRRAGVDLIALLALVGTLLVGEFVAGALISVMLATGRALDAAAERRASRDLRALLERAPRTARRRVGAQISEIPLEQVLIDDLLMVGPGEVVPVDGQVQGSVAVLDESALTGEADPVERAVGSQVRSGVLNAGSAFELRATATAATSTYAGVVALVQQAGAESAPVIRLADRYATWFLPLSLAAAGLAWLISGSLVRAVAVLVVATPCPLLLAAPVAIVSGLSRASRIGVVIRSGVALESLGRARTMVVDKTGTLTAGRPVVIDVDSAPGWEATEVLRLAASADQLSPHVLAEAIVAEARARQLPLIAPTEVSELPGRGIAATLGELRVDVGKQLPGSTPPP